MLVTDQQGKKKKKRNAFFLPSFRLSRDEFLIWFLIEIVISPNIISFSDLSFILIYIYMRNGGIWKERNQKLLEDRYGIYFLFEIFFCIFLFVGLKTIFLSFVFL